MMRKILTIVLPLALPVVIYWIYLALARRRARRSGEGKPPDWQDAPWTAILAASVVLMSASLIAFGLSEGHDAGTRLAPPRLVDGEIVPGQPIEE